MKRIYLLTIFFTISGILTPLKAQQIYQDLLDSLNNLSLEKYEMEEYPEALAYSFKALDFYKNNIDKNLSNYTMTLNNLAACYHAINSISEAIKYSLEALKRQQEMYGKEHPNYIIALNNLAFYYEEAGEYIKSIQIYKELIPLEKRLLGKDNLDYAKSLSNLAICYYYTSNYLAAIKLNIEASKILTARLGTNNRDYAMLLNNLANCYASIGRYNKAINVINKSLRDCKDYFGKELLDYSAVLNNLKYFYNEIKDFDNVNRLNNILLTTTERTLGKNNEYYLELIVEIAFHYEKHGDYYKAIELYKEAISTYEEIEIKEPINYIICLNNLALISAHIGNYDDAINLNIKALSICEEKLGKYSEDYITILNNQASLLGDIGIFSKAIKLNREAIKICNVVYQNEYENYIIPLNELALSLYHIGNYEEAINVFSHALEFCKKELGTEHYYYIMLLQNLAVCYDNIGDYFKATELYTEALTTYEHYFETENMDYYTLLQNLSLCYAAMDDYSKAVRFASQALNFYKKDLGGYHPKYAHSLHTLASCYYSAKDYESAIKLTSQAINIVKSVFGVEHPYYTLFLNNLCQCYHINNDVDNLIKNLLELFETDLLQIRHSMSSLISSDRVAFWNKNGSVFNNDIPHYAYSANSKTLNELVYNSVLISKGVILDTEIEFSKLIAESKDEEALRIYKELQHTRTFLNKQYEKPVSERVVNTDSLETVAEELEEQLIERSQVYGDFTKNLSIDWKQVQKQLGKDDIAIEFVSFSVSKDSTMYCALTLKKGYDAPKLIPLFEEHQLDSVNRAKCYESTAITELVWKPLDEELKEIKNIYFAPDGELYNIAVESLPHYDGEGYMFDRWNFYRLSSTRELAKIKYHPSETKAALYGGLNYDTDITTMENSQQTFDELYIAQYRSEPDSIGLRARYGTLRGTWDEVMLIDSLYSNLKYPSVVYTHNTGTEASLKNLDGQKVSNLHIATHGFYWTETELNEKEDLRGLPFIRDNDRPRFVEDKAMTRSGLLFAGANKVLSGKTVPEGYDDGILTAKEISILDLRGLDLLVLSACQTGLGEIKGDGVYGLQRGFKMAGAQTIIMSLWKVDDDATQMLMTEFYKRYLSSQSKHDAFLAAQEVVRNFKGEIRGRDRDLSDPKYWAGFIMLD